MQEYKSINKMKEAEMMDDKLFDYNRYSITLICEVVQDFRKQNFFMGASKFSQLLKYLDKIAQFIFLNEDCETIAEELHQILPALLQAQNSQDYILQADILEGDLLPLLQKLQIWLQNNTKVKLHNYARENMAVLQQKNRELYMQLRESHSTDEEGSHGRYAVTLAINGQPTIQVKRNNYTFFMHSTVNPEMDANIFVEELPVAEQYVVLGLGLGYHLFALLKKYPDVKVTVLESELYLIRLALQYQDWTKYLRSGQVVIIYNPDIGKLVNQISAIQQPYELLVYYPTVQAVENDKIRQLLEDFFITVSSMREQKYFLDANFKKNTEKYLPDCSALKSLFYKQNIVIVGAGPSVNGQLEYLKKYRDKLRILATGHISRLLLKQGIIPDAIIITDSQPHMYKQVEGLDTKDIPLILLSTASSSVMDCYKGKIYIAFQEGYKPAEDMAKSMGVETYETGGSVTTTALDIALKFEAERIIFVGVDLAYIDGNSHAEGVGRKVTNLEGLRKVVSCNGEELYTSKNLDIYRKWIERRIKNVKGIGIYNTGNGAKIEGTQMMVW